MGQDVRIGSGWPRGIFSIQPCLFSPICASLRVFADKINFFVAGEKNPDEKQNFAKRTQFGGGKTGLSEIWLYRLWTERDENAQALANGPVRRLRVMNQVWVPECGCDWALPQ